ncbi:MAG: 50S ribosomal protein L6 [Alphaproteobacteria bacterium]
MSRVGKNPVAIPQGVEVQVNGQDVKVKGKLGEQTLRLHHDVSAKLEDEDGQKIIRLTKKNESEIAPKIWPTMRVLVGNMMIGVTKGYTKKLEIRGVGFRANLQGTTLVMALGFSHEIRYPIPQGITVKVENQVNIEVTGIDKQKVGQVAADIRGFKPPEPYQGKGIRYVDEYVVRKEGKKK